VENYDLVEATTVPERLAQAAGRTPDLILLELGLPASHGW
jgi:DNA-binding response OmpR family regulator